MPTVMRREGWRLFFYSNEGSEPPHVHIESADGAAKLWLDPVSLVGSSGIRPRELRRMERLVNSQREALLDAWHEHFGN
jgi:hypothetical protein